MSIISFFKLVEIQTKLASVIPFFLGSLYSIYRFQAFNIKNFFLMFISLLCFDMATTAINNYVDYKKAQKTEGYNYEVHNAIVQYNLKEFTVVITIILLIGVAVCFGWLLYLRTSLFVLALGVLSFLVGILYTFGPLPISRMPLGEVFSGFFMGFLIPLIAAYIHISDLDIISLTYDQGSLKGSLNVVEGIYLFLFSIPAIAGIGNLMLANNICDIEDDIQNNRTTLPIFIGREKALQLFKWIYILAYIDIIVLILLGILPWTGVLILITIGPVKKHVKQFMRQQTKKDTFVIAVKNFMLLGGSQVVAVLLGLLFIK
ncbi:MAG: 1,4-dihydroxy-2-naphthoate polyprenyltransferase [Epulopiscium sp.]|nr:1,4-dihydroxy-2-naphthoate polyprenyltransferase [Candidatus Epulonipiscium sp.]